MAPHRDVPGAELCRQNLPTNGTLLTTPTPGNPREARYVSARESTKQVAGDPSAWSQSFRISPSDRGDGTTLIIPEFGFRTDGVYSECEQADFIRRAMDELAGSDVVAMVVYSLYDQTYFGAEPFFQDAFRSIGVVELDGRPKEAWRLLRRIRWLRDEPIPTGIAPAMQCVTAPRHGSGRR
jgi:hypothetical protein